MTPGIIMSNFQNKPEDIENIDNNGSLDKFEKMMERLLARQQHDYDRLLSEKLDEQSEAFKESLDFSLKKQKREFDIKFNEQQQNFNTRLQELENRLADGQRRLTVDPRNPELDHILYLVTLEDQRHRYQFFCRQKVGIRALKKDGFITRQNKVYKWHTPNAQHLKRAVRAAMENELEFSGYRFNVIVHMSQEQLVQRITEINNDRLVTRA